MFIVAFHTGVKLNATSVEERYGTFGAGEKQASLNIRVSGSAEDLNYYRDIVEAEGACEQITVTDETGFQSVFTGYTGAPSISRALVSGGAAVQISLNTAG